MTDPVLESPLVVIGGSPRRELRVDGRGCLLAEQAFMDVLILRGDAMDERFALAVASATGLALPMQANTAAVQDTRQLIWLGPDEWMLKDAGTEALAAGTGIDSRLATALRAVLSQYPGLHHSVVEVGSGYTTLSLQGPGAADLLARGCPLDLHPRAFSADAVAQSHVARAPVLIRCLRESGGFEVTVRRSFAAYLFHWLCEAGS